MASRPSKALRAVADEAAGCTACDLYANATQVVFGEGPAHAPLFLIGEQPGDHEDKQGHPFVGPAGRILDSALEAASIRRDDMYLTNAVKHFKWEPRGKRRIHQRPNGTEIVACHRWLARELELVKPDVIVVLGAVAGQSLYGSSFRVGKSHGQVLEYAERPVITTIHPSSVLRERDEEARHAAMNGFVEDLRGAVRLQKSRAA
jgi:uracil-DNA glycosylase family protein